MDSEAKTVDGYLANLPKEQKETLEHLRGLIRTTVPQAEEIISYQVPGYKHKGPLVYFAAFKNHLSFFAVGRKLLKELEKELKPFKVKGTTIHFTPQNPLPDSLVIKIVKARFAENESRKKV